MADEHMQVPPADGAVPDAPVPPPPPAEGFDAPVEDQVAGDFDTPPAGKKGLMSKPGGKALLIGGAIVLLLIVAAAAAFIVFSFAAVDVVEEGLQELTDQVEETVSETVTGTVDPEAADEAEEPETAAGTGAPYSHEAVELTDVHVWRDIFQPLWTPVTEATITAGGDGDGDGDGGGGGGGGDAGPTSFQADTLYLTDIFVIDSASYAEFYLDGITYSTAPTVTETGFIIVGEGDRLEDTPWRLLSIGVTSVTLQYGDSTVVLSLGQGVQK